MALQAFTVSEPLTLGVELELQLVSTHDFDLAPQAEDLLRVLKNHTGSWDVKPEITRSMIEIGTSIQRQHAVLLAELQDLRDQLSRGARKLNIGIAGGGTHAYQHWSEQKIFPGERFHYISELYGYLAKQFTVFGQHVHVGCEDGDRALWLLHALSRYVPHFIALAASSPFVQGRDTLFESARLNSVFAFPLSGRAPFTLRWSDFEAGYFARMEQTGIVKSMKEAEGATQNVGKAAVATADSIREMADAKLAGPDRKSQSAGMRAARSRRRSSPPASSAPIATTPTG